MEVPAGPCRKLCRSHGHCPGDDQCARPVARHKRSHPAGPHKETTSDASGSYTLPAVVSFSTWPSWVRATKPGYFNDLQRPRIARDMRIDSSGQRRFDLRDSRVDDASASLLDGVVWFNFDLTERASTS